MRSKSSEKNIETLISFGVCQMLAEEICEKNAKDPDNEYWKFVFDWSQIIFLKEG